jgi:hypothetical protein
MTFVANVSFSDERLCQLVRAAAALRPKRAAGSQSDMREVYYGCVSWGANCCSP